MEQELDLREVPNEFIVASFLGCKMVYLIDRDFPELDKENLRMLVNPHFVKFAEKKKADIKNGYAKLIESTLRANKLDLGQAFLKAEEIKDEANKRIDEINKSVEYHLDFYRNLMMLCDSIDKFNRGEELSFRAPTHRKIIISKGCVVDKCTYRLDRKKKVYYTPEDDKWIDAMIEGWTNETVEKE